MADEGKIVRLAVQLDSDEIIVPNGVMVSVVPVDAHFARMQIKIYAYDLNRSRMAISALKRLISDLEYKMENAGRYKAIND